MRACWIRRRAGWLIASLSVCAAYAHAANLVVNGDFDAGLSSWTPITPNAGTVLLNSTDGSPSAPSLELTGSLHQGAAANSNCMVVDSSQNFDVRANMKVVHGIVSIHVLVFSDVGCSLGLSQTLLSTSDDGVWQPVSQLNFSLPLAAHSVQLQLEGFGGNVIFPDILDALFDHIEFGPAAATPVRLQSFSVD